MWRKNKEGIMKIKLIIIGIVGLFICGGCSYYKAIVVSTPNRIYPVSLSPVVSMNGKKETNLIRKVEAENFSTVTDVLNTTKREKSNNIEYIIMTAVEEKHNRAVTNLQIQIEFFNQWFPLLTFYKEKSRAEVRGNVVEVK